VPAGLGWRTFADRVAAVVMGYVQASAKGKQAADTGIVKCGERPAY
jgi:hypothetical protein